MTDDILPHDNTRVHAELTDVFDPKVTYRDFVFALTHFEDRPSDERWLKVIAAYKTLCACVTPDQLRQLWQTAKANRDDRNNRLWALTHFSDERDRRYKRSPRYRARQAEYDKARARTPKRQAQINAAKTKHRAKKRLPDAAGAVR